VAARNDNGTQESVGYDRLLIATGAAAIVPPWTGVDLHGVFPLRNLHDTQSVEELLRQSPKRCVIVGGGYVGLEMAEAFRRRGL
jgi:NADPH-dependent 2,4-dienoyl-CoA reductase/sulfur reductase-like enzyme